VLLDQLCKADYLSCASESGACVPEIDVCWCIMVFMSLRVRMRMKNEE